MNSDLTWKGYSLNFNNVFPINGSYYLFGGSNFNIEDTLVLIKLNEEFEIEEKTTYVNPEGGFALLGIEKDDYIYGVSARYFENEAHEEFNVRKLDTLGNVIWSKDFSQEFQYNAGWEIAQAQDGNMFLSSTIIFYDKLGSYGNVVKLDTSGQILWTYEGEEQYESGAIPTWIVELSNGKIVHYYEIREFQANEIVLQWLDSTGQLLFKRVYESPSIDAFHFRQMEVGKGDYLFAYGNYDIYNSETSDRPGYGLLTKYDNNGDTIWTHKYRHPDYLEPLDFHEIEDIVELNNGDIIVMGSVFSLSEFRRRVWVFKVNSDGCYGQGGCEEFEFFTSSQDIAAVSQAKVYPNPVKDELYIDVGMEKFEGRLQIYNAKGELIYAGLASFFSEYRVSTTTYPAGMYYLSMVSKYKSDKTYASKFLVVR